MASMSPDEFARMLAEMRNGYLAELPQRLEDIESFILEADTTADFAELYQALYRTVHSIKGSAGTHGLHFISTICHNFEDSLAEAGDQQQRVTADRKSNWLAWVDLLENAQQLYEDGVEDFTALEEQVAQLRQSDPEVLFNALIIEPSAMHAKICEQVFSKHGVSFSYARDGFEALERLLNEPFDMLITSLQVPRLNGIALITALKLARIRNSEIPTLLLTSSKETRHVRKNDPDYIVQKNSNMLASLDKIAVQMVAVMKSRHAG